MDRNELAHYIKEHFSVEPDYPWTKFPNYCVYRHKDSSKWFALVMDVEAQKVSPEAADQIKDATQKIDVVDLKVQPELVGSLRLEKDIFPAYHMNKEHWVSVKLAGSLDDSELKDLIEKSFQLTVK